MLPRRRQFASPNSIVCSAQGTNNKYKLLLGGKTLNMMSLQHLIFVYNLLCPKLFLHVKSSLKQSKVHVVFETNRNKNHLVYHFQMKFDYKYLLLVYVKDFVYKHNFKHEKINYQIYDTLKIAIED